MPLLLPAANASVVVDEDEAHSAGVAAETVVAPSGERAGDKRPLKHRAVAVALAILLLSVSAGKSGDGSLALKADAPNRGVPPALRFPLPALLLLS